MKSVEIKFNLTHQEGLDFLAKLYGFLEQDYKLDVESFASVTISCQETPSEEIVPAAPDEINTGAIGTTVPHEDESYLSADVIAVVDPTTNTEPSLTNNIEPTPETVHVYISSMNLSDTAKITDEEPTLECSYEISQFEGNRVKIFYNGAFAEVPYEAASNRAYLYVSINDTMHYIAFKLTNSENHSITINKSLYSITDNTDDKVPAQQHTF